MLKQGFVSHKANDIASSHFLYYSFSNPKFNFLSCPKKPPRLASCVVNVGFQDIAEVTHNKVLIAAGFSAAIGQLSKPFTSVVFYGKNLDFRTAFQAGGFPSTHSSSVVAAATAIAFERGFADSIFGLTVVYAALIMYDAQGVRREVGKHARMLNKLPSKTLKLDEISEESVPPLKESIGHTQVEVIAGALFGFFVSFGVYSLL